MGPTDWFGRILKIRQTGLNVWTLACGYVLYLPALAQLPAGANFFWRKKKKESIKIKIDFSWIYVNKCVYKTHPRADVHGEFES